MTANMIRVDPLRVDDRTAIEHARERSHRRLAEVNTASGEVSRRMASTESIRRSFALAQNGNAVANQFDFLQQVAVQEDRFSLALEAAQNVPDFSPSDRINAVGRLVENQTVPDHASWPGPGRAAAAFPWNTCGRESGPSASESDKFPTVPAAADGRPTSTCCSAARNTPVPCCR